MSPTAVVVLFVVFWSEGWCELHVSCSCQLQCLHVKNSINCLELLFIVIVMR